ncbi:MAG: DUF1566 domain-containing protein [Candidatus Desulfatibia sp.]|uniref:Lcl domain-containing protein n=1 Tax=Candidatus Desulfatibia sp. TaxID=3101189 RepID=UPI002F327056
MLKKTYLLLLALILIPGISSAQTIDVYIKGVDDGVRTTKQQDYKEAVLFAKREAIERAGVKIKSMTTAKDMVVNSDYIESKAKAALMPGYNIIDIGYSADGTYQIVLIGKVRSAVSEAIDSKGLRYAKSLYDMGKKSDAKKIINDILKNSQEDGTVAEAMYYQVLWKFSSDPAITYAKLEAYYPDSKYVGKLKNLLDEREAERKRISAEKERESKRIAAEKERERKRIAAAKVRKSKRIAAEKERKSKRIAAVKVRESKRIAAAKVRESKRIPAEKKRKIQPVKQKYGIDANGTGIDGQFYAFDTGVVMDTKTGLMWAAKDNGSDINWRDAKRYCENYTGGGYTDWRMPTIDELAGLYGKSESYQATQRNYNVYLTELIELSTCCPWVSETRGSFAAYFSFDGGAGFWDSRSYSDGARALPVRKGK